MTNNKMLEALRTDKSFARKFVEQWEHAVSIGDFLRRMNVADATSANASQCATFLRENNVGLKKMPHTRKAREALDFSDLAALVGRPNASAEQMAPPAVPLARNAPQAPPTPNGKQPRPR